MDEPVEISGPLDSNSSPTLLPLLEVDSDVPENCSQPTPPGTHDTEEIPVQYSPGQDAENPKIDDSENETAKPSESENLTIETKSDDSTIADVSTKDESEPVNDCQEVEVGNVDSVCSKQLDTADASKATEKAVETEEPVVLEIAVVIEPVALEKAVSEEQVSIEEPVPIELVSVEEPVPIELVSVEVADPIEDPVAIEIPITAEEPVAINPIPTEELVATDVPVSAEESVAVEKPIPTLKLIQEPVPIENPPATQQDSQITAKSSKIENNMDSNNPKSKASEPPKPPSPQPCSSRSLSKRPSCPDCSISPSPRRKCARSRSISPSPRRRFSRSPVRFRASSRTDRRNYRRHSPTSSSSPSPPRYRSRSPSRPPSRRRRRTYSSVSTSSASSPRRRRPSSSRSVARRSTEKRYRRDSSEYCEAGGSRPKVNCARDRSASRSPKGRRSSRRSRSTSPKGRLRRMLAHEKLSKNTGNAVRVDSSRSFSNHQDGEDDEARISPEGPVEPKSTVNSEKSLVDDLMDVFHKKLRVIKKRLRHERREFRKRPESYPSFSDEWRTFWSHRFGQIQAEGQINPHSYDYKPDWTRYWLVRVKEIYKAKYKKLKIELKESLGVSSESKNEKVTAEVVEISDGDEPEIASPWEEEPKNESTEPKTDDQKSNDVECAASKPESKEEVGISLSAATMQQLNLLTQTLSAMSSACSQNSVPPVESVSNSKESPSASSLAKSDDSFDIDLNDDISIISVLRQLSVLEAQLGTSAPLITNLLANGLAREKKMTGSSTRLLTHENRLFLDVIKEKLKGQLQLEVVPDIMVKATKKCIKSIDELMRIIPEQKVLDPRLNRVFEQKFGSASSPATSASNHMPFGPKASTSMPGSHVPQPVQPPVQPPHLVQHQQPIQPPPPAQPHPVQPPPPVQPHPVQAPQHQYQVRSDPYAPIPHRPPPRQPANSVNAANLVRPLMEYAVPAPSAPLRHSVPVGTLKNNAYSNQPPVVREPPVQPASTGAPSATTYSFDNQSKPQRRPSIYDRIPWSEQLAFNAASGATCQPSASGSHPSDPRHATMSSNWPPVSQVNASFRSQPPISSASHPRPGPTTYNIQTVPPASYSSNPRMTAVPSQSSGLPSMVPAFNGVGTPPMSSYNPVGPNGNAVFSNTTTTTPSTGSQMTAAPATVANSVPAPSQAAGPVIDLTDDIPEPEYDESTEPIHRLSEVRIIELLKNFRQLPRARQQELVDFLRQLEKTNMPIVENFKKYVQLPFCK